MIPVLVTEPTAEPLTIEEVKLHLRIDYDAEDSWIAQSITAARQYVEDMTSRQMVTATRRVFLDHFPCVYSPDYSESELICYSYQQAFIILPRPPLATVTSITYTDTDSVSQTLSSSIYNVDTDSVPGRVYLAYGQSWPSTLCIPKAVSITYTCGYGAPCDVPRGLKSAMKLLIGTWYENRESVAFGAPYTVPNAFDSLLSQYKVQGAR